MIAMAPASSTMVQHTVVHFYGLALLHMHMCVRVPCHAMQGACSCICASNLKDP